MVLAEHAGEGFAFSARALHLMAHAIERGGTGCAHDGSVSARGLGDGARAAMFGGERFGFGARFDQLLVELAERGFQILHLHRLVAGLLAEARGDLLKAKRAFQRGAGQVLLLLIEREFGLLHELLLFGEVLVALGGEQVVVGDGDGHLRFHLHELVLHVEDHLFEHLLGVFGPIDEVIEIGPQKRGHEF